MHTFVDLKKLAPQISSLICIVENGIDPNNNSSIQRFSYVDIPINYQYLIGVTMLIPIDRFFDTTSPFMAFNVTCAIVSLNTLFFLRHMLVLTVTLMIKNFVVSVTS